MRSNSFSGFIGEGGDFFSAFQSMTYGTGTFQPKKLPAAIPVPAIPARVGASPRVKAASSGISGFTLLGPQIVTSSDGLLTISYPETVETIVDSKTLVIPAISASP